jgi:hypothetical protein
VALCEMVKELRHAELAANASTEEFIRHAQTAFHDHALHAVAKKIADEVFPGDDGATTELYAHFSSALISDLGLTDVVAHQTHARKYGDTAQYGGYSTEKVKELVLETVRKDGAFEAFLCSGDWPHWESHVAHQNQEHFAQFDTTTEAGTTSRKELIAELTKQYLQSDSANFGSSEFQR